MTQIRFNFLDTNSTIVISENKSNINTFVTNPPEEFTPTNQIKTKKNNSLSKSIFFDTKAINQLQLDITECLNYHSNLNLIPNYLPGEIDVRFLNTNYFTQIINAFQNKEKTALTSNNFKNKLILLSADLINDFNPEYLNNNFLDICRKRIFGKCKDIEKTKKILIETYFLHELAHQILNTKYVDTILISGFNTKTIQDNALKQITDNIQEAFCDSFSTYLTNIKYPEMEIIKRFSIIREEDNKTNNKNYTILPYNISEAIKEVQHINENDIDKLVDVLLENTITHTLHLTHQALLDDKNIEFKENLCENLTKITLSKQLDLSSNQNILKTLRKELLINNPVPQSDLDEQKSLMFKMKQFRKKLTKNKSEYFIHNKM